MGTTTNAKKENAVAMYNAAREAASDAYQRATTTVNVQTDFSTAMAPLIQYTPFMNEFLSFIVNKIVFQTVERKMYNNQYTMLKADGFPLGTDFEMSYVNPAMGRDYSIELGDTLLARHKPDVKTAYFRQNRRRQFPVTIPRELMEGAYTRWEQLDDMVSAMINSLYSGNAIEEENLIIKLLSTSVSNNVIKTQPVAWNAADPAESSLNLLKAVRRIGYNITHASADYNNYKAYATAQGITNATDAITWTEKDDLVVFISSEALVDTELETWAGAFNLRYADFASNFVVFPSFDYLDVSQVDAATGYYKKIVDPSNILAIVTDKRTFEYRDNLSLTGDFYNAAGLYRNQYLNVWQTYSVRPWGNAIALTKQA